MNISRTARNVDKQQQRQHRIRSVKLLVFFTLLSEGAPMLVLSKSGVSLLGGTNICRIYAFVTLSVVMTIAYANLLSRMILFNILLSHLFPIIIRVQGSKKLGF